MKGEGVLGVGCLESSSRSMQYSQRAWSNGKIKEKIQK
ncbi:hypothetical protein ES705_02962 [subsurface metagenome]